MYCGAVLKAINLKSGVRSLLRRLHSSQINARNGELLSNHKLSLELGKKSVTFSEQDGYVMKSPYEPISMPDMTVDQYIWKNMPKWQNHIAIACGVTGRKYTYAKLRDRCAALAIRLRTSLKLDKNDVVAICLPNIPGQSLFT